MQNNNTQTNKMNDIIIKVVKFLLPLVFVILLINLLANLFNSSYSLGQNLSIAGVYIVFALMIHLSNNKIQPKNNTSQYAHSYQVDTVNGIHYVYLIQNSTKNLICECYNHEQINEIVMEFENRMYNSNLTNYTKLEHTVIN